MATEVNEAKFAQKMLAVMKAIPFIEKTGRNEHFKYDFASESEVLHRVRTAMIEHGLTILPAAMTHERQGDLTVIQCSFTLMDAETGFSVISPWFGEAQDKQDKGCSKAMTSAVKYFLLKAFLIPTGEDPDSDGPVEPKAAQKAAQRPQSPNVDATHAGKWYKSLEGSSSEGHAKHVQVCGDMGLRWDLVYQCAESDAIKTNDDLILYIEGIDVEKFKASLAGERGGRRK